MNAYQITDLTFNKYKDFDIKNLSHKIIEYAKKRFGMEKYPTKLTFNSEAGQTAHTKIFNGENIRIYLHKDFENFIKTYPAEKTGPNLFRTICNTAKIEDFGIVKFIYVVLHEFHHNMFYETLFNNGAEYYDFKDHMDNLNDLTTMAIKSHDIELGGPEINFEEIFVEMYAILSLKSTINFLVDEGDLNIAKVDYDAIGISKKITLPLIKKIAFEYDLDFKLTKNKKEIFKKIDFRYKHIHRASCVSISDEFIDIIKSQFNFIMSNEDIRHLIETLFIFYREYANKKYNNLCRILSLSFKKDKKLTELIPFHGEWEICYVYYKAVYFITNCLTYNKNF